MKRHQVRAKQSDGWWAVDVPAIRGIHTQARTLEEIPAMAADAISLVLDEPVDPVSIDVEVIAE